MRGKIVFLVILAMLVGLVYLVGSRTRDAHVVPARVATSAEDAAVSDAAGGDAPATDTAVATPAEAGAGAADALAAPDAEGTPLERPLRVVAASWELAAPLLAANQTRTAADAGAGGASAPDVRVEVASTAADVESRLARGGADPEGADVAVVPLPVLVASYERLRALEPEVVHVAGWSRGREVLLGARDGMLARPSTGAADVPLDAEDTTATVFGLFVLDELGTAPEHVRVAPGAKGAVFSALARPLSTGRAADAPAKVLLSTSEAAHLIPLVAVAPRGFVGQHAPALASLLRAWVAGSDALRADVPGVARRIAAEPGAPEPATLLERLGWVYVVDAAEASRALAGADALFQRTWRLLRGAGLLTSAAPPTGVVAREPFDRAFPSPSSTHAPLPAPEPSPSGRTLLAHRLLKGGASEVADDALFLQDVFDPLSIRLTTRPASLAQDAATAARAKGAAFGRVFPASNPLADQGVALIEILGAP